MSSYSLQLLLVQIPNLNESSYLVGVAALKAYLIKKGFHTEAYNPVGDMLSKNPELLTQQLKDQFSNALEYGGVVFSEELLKPVVESMIEKIKSSNPKYLGFSLIYGNVKNTLYLVAEVRKQFPDLTLMLGGPGVKLLKDDDRKICEANYIFHDDAELTILEFFEALKNENHDPVNLSQILGLEYKVEGLWRRNAVRPTESSLKDFPQPDYADFFTDPCASQLLSSHPLSLGRGCPFRCRFCAVRNYGSNYRHYEIEDCIAYLKKEIAAGKTHFMVHDPITNGNPHWIRNFCEAVIRENLKFTWGGSIRLSKYLNETKTLDLLFEAGFRVMITGMESAAPNVLKHMKKFDNVEIVDEIFLKIKKFKETYPDIKVLLQIIVGYPNETESDFQMTLNFVKNQIGVVDEILTCSSFLMIQSENDDLMEMTRKAEFGMNVISESNWSSWHSTPAIRQDRMKRAEECFKSCNIPYRIFYDEHLTQLTEDTAAKPIYHEIGS